MDNKDFIVRLRKLFEGESMADVARRLDMPHATVRNYYNGRLPAPEVLMKIANETGVSLNWLLIGAGDMYGGQRPPIGLGKFLEERITEIVDQRIASLGKDVVTELKTVDFREAFDVEAAVLKFKDPQSVMSEWFRYEGREYPQDYGIVFFRGWAAFSQEDRVAAVYDAKRVLDRSL
jgi:transcriptional regulator with XRE-family HTH domain